MINNLQLIVGYDNNKAIGRLGDMPWGRSLRDDLKNFKDLTLNNTVIMGRATFDSIGHPLPSRKNIVLSRDKSLKIDGVQVINSIDELSNEDINGTGFIIGGAQVYKLALPFVDKVIASEVEGEFEADTLFDEFNASDWKEVSRRHIDSNARNKYAFDIVEYVRE